MVRSLQRLDQIAKPSEFDDQKTATEIANSETNSSDFLDFNSNLLSQIKRIIHGSDSGNWFDDPETVFGGSSTLKSLYYAFFKDVVCLSTDLVGKCMSVRDQPVGDQWSVQTADPYDLDKMPSIGVLVSKSTSTTGIMQVLGPCDIFSGLDITKPVYFVGINGDPVSVCPSASGSSTGKLYVQVFGKAISTNILFLNPNLNMTKLRS